MKTAISNLIDAHRPNRLTYLFRSLEKTNPEIAKYLKLSYPKHTTFSAMAYCSYHQIDGLCECGEAKKLVSFNKGFRKFCPHYCTYAQKHKQQYTQQVALNPDVQKKKKQTSILKYGVDHHSKSDEYILSRKKYCQEKYGVESNLQSNETKLKIQKTLFKRYKCHNISQRHYPDSTLKILSDKNKFKEFMPETLITRNYDDIKNFRKEFKEIIIKPLYGNGGKQIFYIEPENQNFPALIEMFFENSNEPIIVQRYLPEVKKGDCRVILIDGEIGGAINRIPQSGDIRSNLHVGGKPEKKKLNNKELLICEALGNELKSRGLILVGIDIIGGYLTEINVTSPTGIQEISKFENTNLSSKIWDVIENKL